MEEILTTISPKTQSTSHLIIGFQLQTFSVSLFLDGHSLDACCARERFDFLVN